jgi:hypothetical protein
MFCKCNASNIILCVPLLFIHEWILRNEVSFRSKGLWQHNTRNYWVFGICPSSSILQKARKTHRFGKWICFRPQVMGWQTTLLDPLHRDNLNHWMLTLCNGPNRICVWHSKLANSFIYRLLEHRRWRKSKNPVIPMWNLRTQRSLAAHGPRNTHRYTEIVNLKHSTYMTWTL